MYLPSEAIYYELACGKTGALLAYAHDKRVLPVSPTTLTAYLQVIVLGLKGLQIEQHAQEVMAYCSQLQSDFGKFKEDFELVGTHVGRAQNKFVDAQKRLGRFESKLEQAGEAAELPAERTSSRRRAARLTVGPRRRELPASGRADTAARIGAQRVRPRAQLGSTIRSRS